MQSATEAEEGDGGDTPLAALHHLTGASRSTVSWLHAARLSVVVSPDTAVRVVAAPLPPKEPGIVAGFRQAGGTYLIEAAGGATVWVNGRPLRERQLRHGDMIEFGEDGPLSRFELIDADHPMRRSVPAIVEDTLAYLRVSRRPLPQRLWRGIGGMAARLLRETTLLFRIAVLVALAAVAWLAVHQAGVIGRLERGMEAGSARLDAVAAALAEARQDALRPADLETLRRELAGAVHRQSTRIETLEQLSAAVRTTISASRGSVALLLGAFGLREPESGRMLRLVTGPDGRVITSPAGTPLLTLGGDGPVAERVFTGTGFLIGADGWLATNRHVALPWERDPAAIAATDEGLEPVLLRFQGFLPGRAEPLDATLVGADDAADLAVIALAGAPGKALPLPLAPEPPAIGATVVVLGYPTGLRSLLAQTGEGFVADLKAAGETDVWSVARRLAAGDHIRPLASRGIVGQIGSAALVFDAETTHGGSGGPVLDLSGRVVAVQSAILPEYGGSNLGVPVEALEALLGRLEGS